MVQLTSLWLPIVASAVLVFVASSIIHMALTYHQNDYRAVPAEDQVQASLRGFAIPAGDYLVPCPASRAASREPAFLDRMKRGPIVVMTVMAGEPRMGTLLVQWFGFCVVVSLFAAYLTSRAIAPGAAYLTVSQIASTAAFMGYGLGAVPQSIWYRRSWATTGRTLVDALIYGFITGGTFGWLWPAA
jgi:hypothetical protein